MEEERTYPSTAMNDKVKISNNDAGAMQAFLWMLTIASVLVEVPFFFRNFNLNLLLIFLMTIAVFAFLHYHSFNSWNIWYENGNIHFKNLYKERTVSVERFKKVETVGISRYDYRLYLDNNEAYYFSLGGLESLKLFFKMDREHYAKMITAKLLELKNQRSIS